MIGQAKRLYELNSLLNAKDSVQDSARIISVTSGKGGTGKSFISSNLAYDLAKGGAKVLLIDLDINLSNLGTFFNISSKKSIYHYLSYDFGLEDVIFNYNENIDIILGESGKLDHPEFTEEKVTVFFNDLHRISSKYDYVIFDTASGISKPTIQLLNNSDEIIIVSTPEPTSVMDAYVVVKMLKSSGFSSEINIIVNKCANKIEGQSAFDNLEKAVSHFLKSKVNFLGELIYSQSVVKSIQNQFLLLSSDNSSEISHQLHHISSKITIPTIG